MTMIEAKLILLAVQIALFVAMAVSALRCSKNIYDMGITPICLPMIVVIAIIILCMP